MLTRWYRKTPRQPIVRKNRPWIEHLEDRITPTALLPDLHVLASYLPGGGTSVGNVTATSNGTGGWQISYSTAMANGGQGAFELRGQPQTETGTDGVLRQLVNQRVYQSDGTFQDRAAGYFVYHPTHGHVHFEDMAFGRLRIRTNPTSTSPYGGVGDVVALGPKTSFALIDINHYNSSLPGSPSSGQYPTSDNTVQGISVGWNDVYGSGLAGQQIDVTGVANGAYWLEIECDPNNNILETDDTNNVTRVPIILGGVASSGFHIYSSTPLGANANPVSYVELNFSQPVDPNTFDLSDV